MLEVVIHYGITNLGMYFQSHMDEIRRFGKEGMRTKRFDDFYWLMGKNGNSYTPMGACTYVRASKFLHSSLPRTIIPGVELGNKIILKTIAPLNFSP